MRKLLEYIPKLDMYPLYFKYFSTYARPGFAESEAAGAKNKKKAK